jgi:hypothetical protein
MDKCPEEALDESEENIYNKKQREHMLEDDEISAIEEEFIQGYEEAGRT